MNEPVDMWTQSHDGGKCYGAMTTNISKCFIGVLKGARSLPITAMIEFTWSKLIAYFHDQHKETTMISCRVKGEVHMPCPLIWKISAILQTPCKGI